MAGAIAGAMEKGRAPAMLNTPRSLAALCLSCSTSTTSARSTAAYTPKPSPLMAMPTRKPLKLLGDTPPGKDDRDAGCQRDNEDADGTAHQAGDHPWPPHAQP